MNYLTALVIVTGVAVSEVSAVSLTAGKAKMEVLPSGENQFQLFFTAEEEEKVSIRLYDNQNKLLFIERTEPVVKFTKRFNLNKLPDGVYTFVVYSKKQGKVKQEVLVSRKASDLLLDEVRLIGLTDDKKVVLLANKTLLNNLSVVAFDQEGHEIYQEVLEKGSKISKSYDFSKLYKNKEVRMVITQGYTVIEDTSFKF